MKTSGKLSLLISQIIFFALWPIWIQLTQYLHPLVIGVVWFCITLSVLFMVCGVRQTQIYIPKQLLHLLIGLYSIGLLILLFFRPNNQNYENTNLIPFETIYFYLSGSVDFLIAFYNLSANIGLFIPYGLYYGYIKKNATILQLLRITTGIIVTIECLQFLTKRGSLDIDDLILNVLGVCLGYLIYPLFRKVLIIN